MFTNFKIPADVVAERLAELRASYSASLKPGTFEDNALRVIGDRMQRHPQQFVEFGPYWWAVKEALNGAGRELGEAGDPLVLAEYRGASVIEALVAAEVFKDYYRASYIVGTCRFDLSGDGVEYELADADMQARVGTPA